MRFETQLLHNGNEMDPHTGEASIPIYQPPLTINLN